MPEASVVTKTRRPSELQAGGATGEPASGELDLAAPPSTASVDEPPPGVAVEERRDARPSGETRGWLQTGQASSPAGLRHGDLRRRRRVVQVDAHERAAAEALRGLRRRSGRRRPDRRPRTSRAAGHARDAGRSRAPSGSRSQCRTPSASGARRAKRTLAPSGIQRGSAAEKPFVPRQGPARAGAGAATRDGPRPRSGSSVELGVLSLPLLDRAPRSSVRTPRSPNREEALARRRIPPHEQPRPVAARPAAPACRPAAAARARPRRARPPAASSPPRRARRELGPEAVVEVARRSRRRRPGTPRRIRRRGATPCASRGRGRLSGPSRSDEPLQIRRADEVRHRAAEPALRAGRARRSPRQLSLDAELAQHHRAEARRSAVPSRSARPRRASRSPPMTHRGASSASGPNGAGDSRSRQRSERLRGPGQVDDVGDLVRREQRHPVRVVAETGLRPGGEVQRTIAGRSRNGTAVPLASASGIRDDDVDARAETRIRRVRSRPRGGRLDRAGRVPRPRLERRRKVDAEVHGLDRAPVRRRPLRRGRRRGRPEQRGEPRRGGFASREGYRTGRRPRAGAKPSPRAVVSASDYGSQRRNHHAKPGRPARSARDPLLLVSTASRLCGRRPKPARPQEKKKDVIASPEKRSSSRRRRRGLERRFGLPGARGPRRTCTTSTRRLPARRPLSRTPRRRLHRRAPIAMTAGAPPALRRSEGRGRPRRHASSRTSPAAKAGVQVGDIVTTVDGEKVGSTRALSAPCAATRTARRVKIDPARPRREDADGRRRRAQGRQEMRSANSDRRCAASRSGRTSTPRDRSGSRRRLRGLPSRPSCARAGRSEGAARRASSSAAEGHREPPVPALARFAAGRVDLARILKG